MKILWVKVGGLWPLNTGGRLRSFHLISELSHRHQVTVLTTHGPEDDPRALPEALPHCKEIISIPYALPKQGSGRFAVALLRSWISPLPVDLWKCRAPRLSEEAKRRLNGGETDLCVADFLAATPNVPFPSPVPVVFFAHNVEHMIWRRMSRVERSLWRRSLFEIEWRKMRRREARVCSTADVTIAVSDVDRRLLSALAPSARVMAIPTGVDIEYFSPVHSGELPAHLVFVGAMDWHPNEDAVLYFAGEILPRIRRELPEVGLTVVGRNPTARLAAAAVEAGFRLTGTVRDVRPYLAQAAVVVVPLRIGGGTRLKIFEALAMGKAVVSTRVGAEGLPLVSGEHFIQEDEPERFARAVIDLVRDPSRRRELGNAGLRLVESRYSWPQVSREFEQICEEVVHHHAY